MFSIFLFSLSGGGAGFGGGEGHYATHLDGVSFRGEPEYHLQARILRRCCKSLFFLFKEKESGLPYLLVSRAEPPPPLRITPPPHTHTPHPLRTNTLTQIRRRDGGSGVLQGGPGFPAFPLQPQVLDQIIPNQSGQIPGSHAGDPGVAG